LCGIALLYGELKINHSVMNDRFLVKERSVFSLDFPDFRPVPSLRGPHGVDPGDIPAAEDSRMVIFQESCFPLTETGRLCYLGALVFSIISAT